MKNKLLTLLYLLIQVGCGTGGGFPMSLGINIDTSDTNTLGENFKNKVKGTDIHKQPTDDGLSLTKIATFDATGDSLTTKDGKTLLFKGEISGGNEEYSSAVYKDAGNTTSYTMEYFNADRNDSVKNSLIIDNGEKQLIDYFSRDNFIADLKNRKYIGTASIKGKVEIQFNDDASMITFVINEPGLPGIVAGSKYTVEDTKFNKSGDGWVFRFVGSIGISIAHRSGFPTPAMTMAVTHTNPRIVFVTVNLQ